MLQASNGRPVWNDHFPKPEHMVTKAHALGLKPGWYLNNCGCAENHLNASMADTIMKGSVKMAADMGYGTRSGGYDKLGCGYFSRN